MPAGPYGPSAAGGQMLSPWAAHNAGVVAQAMPQAQQIGHHVPTHTPHGMPYCADESYGYMADLDATCRDNRLITAQRYDDHWIDLRGEYVYFTREDSLGAIPLTSAGVTGPIVLDTSALTVNDTNGLRLAAFIDPWHSCDIELSWFGNLRWTSSAQVNSTTNSLYSAFSDFGLDPAQGFEETDQATTHGVQYTSELNNFELNARFRWSHTTKPITGSWIFGVRYLQLDDRFRYHTFAQAHIDPISGLLRGPGEMNYVVDVSNDLVGFQCGMEGFVSPIPGLLVGGEVEVGVYGNSAKSDTKISATSINGRFLDERRRGQTAFVGEANLTAIYRVVHELYIRGGYQILFVEGVSLGPDNFNSTSPFVQPRPSTFDTNGDLLLHGFHAGLEWQW
jgi:hypothetical protein